MNSKVVEPHRNADGCLKTAEEYYGGIETINSTTKGSPSVNKETVRAESHFDEVKKWGEWAEESDATTSNNLRVKKTRLKRQKQRGNNLGIYAENLVHKAKGIKRL